MQRPDSLQTQSESNTPVLKRVMPLIIMVLVISGVLTYLGITTSNSPQRKKARKQQIKLEPLTLPQQKGKPVIPLPVELLKQVKDRTLISDKQEPAHDKLRQHVDSLSLAAIDKLAKPTTGLMEKLSGLRGQWVELRGKLVTKIQAVSIPNRPSGLQVVEVGTLQTSDDELIRFEMVSANIHGARKGEQVILRGACYKLANLTDRSGKHQILPFVIGKRIEIDYSAYLPRMQDGKKLEDYYYYMLMRKVRFDRPDQIEADSVPAPTIGDLGQLDKRDKLRGKYVSVTGRLLEVRKHELQNNRAFITDIYRGKLQTESGIWCFDSLEKPAYMPFLQNYKLRLTGAFAKRYTWTDDTGKTQKTPYLISKGLELAADKPEFVPQPEILSQITDGKHTRDLTYYYLLHKVVSMTDEQVNTGADREFTLSKIVSQPQRDQMRGAVIQVRGQLLKVEEFPLEFKRRLNPSGVTTIYRLYLATSRPTIYTVDVLEKPKTQIKGEITVRGAFWKVYLYPTRNRNQSEKSPYLIARRAATYTPPPSAAHDQFLLLIIALMVVLIIFLGFVGRAEWRKAGQFREEIRQRRHARGTATTPDQVTPAEGPEQSGEAPTEPDQE